MCKREDTAADAVVRVENADGAREVRMRDFLREIADDGGLFERVGSMKPGDVVEAYGGRTLRFTVRRIG
jgi:hypothetical protein